MRARTLSIAGLEAYALFLALFAGLRGITTDEAKYLLSIPYPHPPFARSLIAAVDAVPGHEFLIRLLFATIIVQSVWLICRLARRLRPGTEVLLGFLYLASSAVIIHGGTVMMSVLTAWQGLLFLVIALDPAADAESSGATVRSYLTMFLWLLSLFTAYHAILFLPLVVGILRRDRRSWREVALAIGAPIVLLILYSLSNPLAIVRMVGTAATPATPTERVMSFVQIWALGGSIVLSAMGTIGLLRSRRWDVLGAFGLVCLYVFVARMPYHAILFTPFFVIGCLWIPHRLLRSIRIQALAVCSVAILSVAMLPPLEPYTARHVSALLASQGIGAGKTVRIVGPFGHQWQYELTAAIVRDTPKLLKKDTDALVCVTQCTPEDVKGMRQIREGDVGVYLKK